MSNFEHEIWSILEVHNKFAETIFVSPYRLTGKDVGLEFHTSKTRWVVFTFLQFLAHALYILSLYSSIFTGEDGRNLVSSPTKLYEAVAYLMYAANYFTIVALYRKKENGIRHLLTVVHRFAKPKPSKRSQILKWISISICLIDAIVTILTWASYTGVGILRESDDDFIFREYGISLDSMGTLKRILNVAAMLFQLYTNTATQLSQLLVTLICFSFLIMSIDFWDFVKQSKSNNLEEEFSCFTDIKELTENISNVVGSLLIFYFIAVIPYFAQNFVKFDKNSLFNSIVVCYYMVVYFIVLVMAAEGHHKVQQFSDHVFKKRLFWKRVDQQQLALMTTELSVTQIGLRGNGWFMISYSFLGSTISVIITYVIIMMQFQNVK